MQCSIKKLAIVATSAAVLLTGFLPAQAMQVPVIKHAGMTDVQKVQDFRHRPRPGWNGGHRPRPGWYGGHRGYRSYRPGYRRYNDGWWYPLAAFGAGAVIGGALASPPPVQSGPAGINPRHFEWCQARYRSYSAYDNTFQPYDGPRQQCYSPYY